MYTYSSLQTARTQTCRRGCQKIIQRNVGVKPAPERSPFGVDLPAKRYEHRAKRRHKPGATGETRPTSSHNSVKGLLEKEKKDDGLCRENNGKEYAHHEPNPTRKNERGGGIRKGSATLWRVRGDGKTTGDCWGKKGTIVASVAVTAGPCFRIAPMQGLLTDKKNREAMSRRQRPEE